MAASTAGRDPRLDQRRDRSPEPGPHRRLTCRPPRGTEGAGGAGSGSPSARRRFKYRRLARAANQRVAGAGRRAPPANGRSSHRSRPRGGSASGVTARWARRTPEFSVTSARQAGVGERLFAGGQWLRGPLSPGNLGLCCGRAWAARKGQGLRAARPSLSFPSCAVGLSAAPPPRRVLRRIQTLARTVAAAHNFCPSEGTGNFISQSAPQDAISQSTPRVA